MEESFSVVLVERATSRTPGKRAHLRVQRHSAHELDAPRLTPSFSQTHSLAVLPGIPCGQGGHVTELCQQQGDRSQEPCFPAWFPPVSFSWRGVQVLEEGGTMRGKEAGSLNDHVEGHPQTRIGCHTKKRARM